MHLLGRKEDRKCGKKESRRIKCSKWSGQLGVESETYCLGHLGLYGMHLCYSAVGFPQGCNSYIKTAKCS